MILGDLQDWELAAFAGDFSRIPNPFGWHGSAGLAHLIDGYEEAGGFPGLAHFANRLWRVAEDTGIWQGSPGDLWLCLFFEHRRARNSRDEPRWLRT